MSLRLKPLRERPEDIVPLFALLLGRALDEEADIPDVPPETQAVLKSYAWTGNAEEMEYAANYAVKNLKNNAVTRDSLPQRIAETQVDPSAFQQDPMQAKALKAFLLARGGKDALAAAEASLRNTQEDPAP
jgi:DNA-binding NtrC family response regulator